MKSFSLLKTNVALTTNIQIVVSSDDQLYMESIDSNQYLSDDKFKKKQFPIDAPYNQLIPTFYGDMTPKYAFDIKYDQDNKEMFNDFSKQFDDIYQFGCSNVKNTDYNEEFECFAPLHFEKNSFPRNFVIFRVDNPGLITLNKDNFKTEILDKLKCVKTFDLSNASNVGQWIKKSFKDEVTFPEFKFNLDVRSDEFSEWSGIDYESGGYTSKSLFMKDALKIETTFFEFDKLITDSYQNLKVVYPNIINFKFLFDDTPATKTSLRKWSVNRYYGFYLDSMDLVKCITPYSPSKLLSGFTIIDDNIISSSNGDPFEKGFLSGLTFVEYFGQFYEVKLTTNGKYKIISPYNLKGKGSLLNKEIISIDTENSISYNTDYNNGTFTIDCFDKADVWLIKINDRYHTLKEDNGRFYIHTDYGFNINNNKLEYWINESDPSYRTTILLDQVDTNNPPITFPIFRLNFTEIKDFDTTIIKSDYARYEYEKKDEISSTLEPKLFVKDENSETNPKEFNEYIFENELVKIPASSEYVGTSEVFEINNPNSNLLIDLTSLWRKNPIFSKWGYEGSLSNGDYPYRLNNNFYGEDLNRSTNIYEPLPNRVERNLDYFYTINADSLDYIDHTLHISAFDDDLNLDTDFTFEIDKYFNVGTVSNSCCNGPVVGTYCNNYFDYLFTKKEYLDNGDLVRNTNKYSVFLQGDDTIPNMTVFRGMKFKVNNVDKVLTNTDQNGKVSIDSISLLSNNNYEDWKFSILLSDFKYNIDDPNFLSDPNLSATNNLMDWEILDIWKLENTYIPNDVVLHHDVLFINTSGTNSTIDEPYINPGNSISWDLATFSTAFWNPNTIYSSGDWVYNYGEYYRNDGFGDIDFYLPGFTYSLNDTVIYRGEIYYSLNNSNVSLPMGSQWTKGIGYGHTKVWDKVEQWKNNFIYGPNSLIDMVYYQGSLYRANSTNINNKPDITAFWDLLYSFEPDTDKPYGTDVTNNNIIEMNNRYYLLLSNSNNDTLDNGINIYINKKWENILVNIYINDNTMDNLKNTNRDDLYTDMSQKLTAKNFVDAMNDVGDKRGFANNINYYVIEKDLTYKKYNIDNITELPILINVEDPDEFDVLIGSMKRNGVNLTQNIINANFKLEDNEINDLSQLNYYNGNPLSIDLSKPNDFDINNLTSKSTFYRFNGNYSPIFREVSLFKRPELCNDFVGNYKFDTELTEFGIMRERVMSKVNLKENVLKLKNMTAVKSIYPQLDEFGYTTSDHFIFKSTWDREYYTKVSKE